MMGGRKERGKGWRKGCALVEGDIYEGKKDREEGREEGRSA